MKRFLVERYQCEKCRADYVFPYEAENCEKSHRDNCWICGEVVSFYCEECQRPLCIYHTQKIYGTLDDSWEPDVVAYVCINCEENENKVSNL